MAKETGSAQAHTPRNTLSKKGSNSLVSSFTLVELLVVIAIISILASMLMPALTGARESAKNIKCVANLKQHAQAVLIYVADHDDHLVPYYQDEPPGAPFTGPIWQTLLIRKKYLTGYTNSPVNAYIKRDLQCPSNHNGYQPNANNGISGYPYYDGQPNYMYNTDAESEDGQFGGALPLKKLAQVVNPSRKLMFTEAGVYAPDATPYRGRYCVGTYIGWYNPGDAVFYAIAGSVHRGRSNAAFFDGHVESFLEGGISNDWADLTAP